MNDCTRIAGIGFAVPDQIWDNHRLEQMVDTSDEWIRTRTGIVTRRIAGDAETTATLAADAANAALKKAGINVLDIDVIQRSLYGSIYSTKNSQKAQTPY